MTAKVNTCRRAEAMNRLMREPWIDVEDWAAIHGVGRNTAYKEAADGKIPGTYRAGQQIRIPSALERQRLGLAEPVQVAA